MKSDFVKLILVLIIGGLVGSLIMKQCSGENPNIRILNQAYQQNEKDIQKINSDIRNILSGVTEVNRQIDSLNKAREKTIKRFNYEISKMDEVFRNNPDTLVVNAYLRCWTERLYRLPGFFQAAADDSGTSASGEDTPAGRELLSSE